MQRVVGVVLVIMGVIHLLPVTGVVGMAQLGTLYDVVCEEENLLVLMHHRAMLFGIVGGVMCYAAWRPEVQGVALAVGGSVTSFLVLAWQSPPIKDALGRVVMVDVAALLMLCVASLVWFLSAYRQTGGA